MRLRRGHAQSDANPVDAVRWALALEYAAAVDAAKANQNLRELLSAGQKLEALLAVLVPSAPAPASGEGVTGDGDPGPASLYALPPAVGDSANP